ncbi:unnamed protein product [Miscanthus lutarioriparius]|uniref:Cellulose synthase-like protein E1 n=1 Tax=Miscanthus lutarioriparius TaxID=422564 RepID=A0A811PMK1_9POAL|nr:unnamed protein product [Miscanthus lutarioriparius]
MATHAYRLFASTVLAGVLLVWLYRATHVPSRSSGARWWAWLGLSAAELWFGFYWVLTLSVRWSPVYRRAFPDQLSRRYKEEQLPGVDIFVCTADPTVEPPMLVISTVLSVMAYDYPQEVCKALASILQEVPSGAQEMHKDLTDRVNSVVNSGKIPDVSKYKLRGFSKWSENTSFRDHPSIVQILIDGNKRKATDVDGNVLPTLVYLAREKRPQEHRHFKAGSLNALIRVSSVISNSPVIMNVDCDMYSNNSGSIRDALCFFQDEEQSQDIAFVQYPQNFENVVHNDIYGNPINSVNEKGVRYGCPLEDVITGLQIQCRGWRSVYHNPPRKGFLGMAPTSLGQILVQHKRWTEGFLQISLSKYSPFLLGHRKIRLGLQMGYSVCGFWALNSFPTLYYVTIPSLCFLNGISLFPEITSPWLVPFAYVVVAAYSCSLVESRQCGDTAVEWWNAQRMWLFRRITSYLLAAIDTIRRMLGITESGFTLTTKVTDSQALERYKKGMMEFGSFSAMFVIIATVALLNLACMMLGVAKVLLHKGAMSLGAMFVQAVLCALIVAINFPVYEALFLRKDSGGLPASVSLISLCIVMPFCILPTNLYL